MTSRNKITIIFSFYIYSMSNSFDLQLEDQCLNFIREDSYPQIDDLFKNYHTVLKDQQFSSVNNLKQPDLQGSGKRKRNQNIKKSTSRKKVFYRQKMANLISEQEMQNCQGYNYGQYCQNSRGKSPISREQQLKRNRQSAKHSRQRRKQYVETLQIKISENQKKIEQLTIKLRQAQLQRDRLKQDNKVYIKSFLTVKSQAYQNLNNILQKNGKRTSQKLSQQLQILIARYGAAGSERIATTDYYVKQIIEILLGDIHKYIVDCAVNDSGLLGLGNWSKLDDEICQILKINKESRVKFSRTYRIQMMEQFQIFKTVAQNFYDAYRAVQNQAKIIQKIFGKFTLEFNDANIAELLLWMEQNKYSKELKRVRAEWARSVQNSQQSTGKARKISCIQKMQAQF